MDLEKPNKLITLISGTITLSLLIGGLVLGNQGKLGRLIIFSVLAIALSIIVYFLANKSRKGLYDARGKLQRTSFPIWGIGSFALIFLLWSGSVTWLFLMANNSNNIYPTILPTQTHIPVIVRLDALAIPSGISASSPSVLSFTVFSSRSASECYTGAECIKIDYGAFENGAAWGMIIWLPYKCDTLLEKAQKRECGINLLEVGNFTKIQKLTFWARGKKGDEVAEFGIGDWYTSPDPGRSSGHITLTNKWEQYEIDLDGIDLTNVTSLFRIYYAEYENQQGATYYLDDIQFEGYR